MTPVIIALNKTDLATDPDQLAANLDAHRALVPVAEGLPTAALHNQGIVEVLAHLVDRLPEGPRYYPEDQLSDITVRNIAGVPVAQVASGRLSAEGINTVTWNGVNRGGARVPAGSYICHIRARSPETGQETNALRTFRVSR